MKILFVSTKKNSDPTERELYEMDLMNDVLGFDRSLLDLGLLTILGGTPERFTTSLQDEYLGPIDYDELKITLEKKQQLSLTMQQRILVTRSSDSRCWKRKRSWTT